MRRKSRGTLADRVVRAAEASLAAQDYVAPIDVPVGIGWLDPGAEKRWRQGQIDCLERAMQTSPPRITEAMNLFRAWASGKGLVASETDYLGRAPQPQPLRFSRSGDPALERQYRTHWVSPDLKASGFNDEQAEAVIRAVTKARDIDLSNLATKADLASFATKADLAELKAELIKWVVGVTFAQVATMIEVLSLFPAVHP